jgi:hypothetical protein
MDAQWVFISGMVIQNGKLVVTNEARKTFVLDPKTGRVDGPMGFWWAWVGAAAAAFWVIHRVRRGAFYKRKITG